MTLFTVYVLYSPIFKKIYIGYTSDLESRFRSHNELSIKGWTKRFRPWIIIHTEMFESKAEALMREKNLKSSKGRDWIWTLVEQGIASGLISV
jgi:putative endonuclease